MKRISIVTGLLMAAASTAAGAAEPADTTPKSLEYQTLATPHERSDRSTDELSWHDYETSDSGTPFLDFWNAQQKVRSPSRLPAQTAPNLAPAAENDETARDKDASSQSQPSPFGNPAGKQTSGCQVKPCRTQDERQARGSKGSATKTQK